MSDELVKRLDDLDPILETEFDTQIAIQRDPYGATKAIEKSLYLLRDQAARIEQLTAERERLALAICGGEDAPGYANAQTVETLEHVAKQNQQSHGATINSLLAAEAERDRLRGGIEYILYGYGLDGPDYRFPYGEEEPDWITDHLIAVMNGESHD